MKKIKMTPQTLSPEYVDAQIYKKEFVKVWDKTTVCLLTLNNWFEIVGISHVFNKENFDEQIWQQEAYNDAFNKAVEFIAFRLNDMDTTEDILVPNKDETDDSNK